MTRAHLVSGGGNDFLALLAPERDPTAGEITAWCVRGLSVGADGVFTLRPIAPGQVEMRHWNADGRPAALCLNGTRCAARLAIAAGWTGDELRITTGAGPFRARRAGPTAIALELPSPETIPRRIEISTSAGAIAGWFVSVGVPHFVVPWPRSLVDCPVSALGAELRHDETFSPTGSNVDFVRFPGPHRLEIRSFERGVEAETLACGTGVLASVAVGLLLERLTLPVRALTRGGFELEVAGDTVDSAPSRWTLAGDARLLGVVELDDEAALAPPPPPSWSD